MDLRSFIVQFMMLLLICISQSASSYSPFARYEEQFCIDTHTGRQLYVGEIFTRLNECIRVQCLGTHRIWEDSCQVPRALKGECRAVASTQLNLEYPKCCPLYECRTYESNPHGTMEQTNTYDHNGKLVKSHITEMIVVDRRVGPEATIRHTGPVRKYEV
ncbi:protein Vago [Drosophila tropicalis]|uniref:protein Vago n=1 Tax=Drosophila tropicalis TaxID=46794 RepID=UPI0035AB8FFE